MHAPEIYEENKSAARRDIDESVPELLSFMKWGKNELILDYGCGAGSTGRKHFVPRAEEMDSHIHAIDVSSKMVTHAREKFPHPRVTYNIGSILEDDFPLKDLQFDRIFAIYVFHYIKDYKEALHRFYKLLKPGSQFGFTVLARSNLFKMYTLLGEDPRFKPYMHGYQKFIPQWYEEEETAEHAEESFRKAVTNSGFTVTHMKIHRQKFFHPKIETLIELYFALNPFIISIPESLHGELRQAYRENTIRIYKLAPDATSVETQHEMLTVVVEKPLTV